MIKHWRYLKYVLRHKYYVFLECLSFGLVWQGITHDWTKFLPSEWGPYVQYFYGDKNEIAFEAAWNYHQKRNPHHWQYWVLLEDNQQTGLFKILPMPDRYRKEMISDWHGVSMAKGKTRQSTGQWYLENEKSILLHDDTRFWIEYELGVDAPDL